MLYEMVLLANCAVPDDRSLWCGQITESLECRQYHHSVTDLDLYVSGTQTGKNIQRRK